MDLLLCVCFYSGARAQCYHTDKNELRRLRKLLSPYYPACTERGVEDDEEDLHSVREVALKVTMHVLKTMDYTDLANTLHNSKEIVLDMITFCISAVYNSNNGLILTHNLNMRSKE